MDLKELANPDLFQSKVSDNFINNIDISSDTVYYWKIVTRDLIGNESISNTFYFSTYYIISYYIVLILF